MLKRICVFCGSSAGRNPAYVQAAAELGRELAARGLELVYGGGKVGLMGVLADAALAGGARVVGVIPRGLRAREVGHDGLSKLHVVPSMHVRKAMMSELADAFIALPGGFGTFEELFEMITWAQLGIHRKPIGLLDVADYFAPLRALIAGAVAAGFVPELHRQLLVVEAAVGPLLEALAAHHLPPTAKWIRPDEA